MTHITPTEKRTKGSALINQRLAGAVDLQLQVKQACWNVQRRQSVSLHELFDEIAKEVESFMDMAAERIVQLGGVAQGTVRVAAARSRLEKHPLMMDDGSQVEAVAKALSDFGCQARAAVEEASALGDEDTADLFAEICRGIEKWLWFVRTGSKTSQYYRRKNELPQTDTGRGRLASDALIKPMKKPTESGFRFLTKLRQKKQILRKEIVCQSSINSRLHPAQA